LRTMVVAVPAYGIPPALPLLVVEAGLGSLWLALVLLDFFLSGPLPLSLVWFLSWLR
jgi:hypothetical protein